ncbi:hypothetical protein AK812_SmicGene40264 [Symbiodinium microadriaticum]|uniref:Uncharacterized protein n=1 Tax=Symbiodinium microadriaticum TaxID=2951 RepID=A0A1Q9C954_SYMMI|nr:hypothetical protein AK812_SmicGene40264 [Symbiodinium microadriaticum]
MWLAETQPPSACVNGEGALFVFIRDLCFGSYRPGCGPFRALREHFERGNAGILAVQPGRKVHEGQCTEAGVMGPGRVFVVTGSSFLLGGWICLFKLAIVAADTCSVPCPEDWPPAVPQTAAKVKRVPGAWQPPAAGEFLPVTPAGVLGSPKAVEVERQIYTLLGGRLARESAIPTPETRVIAAVWPGNFGWAYPTTDGGLIALLFFESNPERHNGALVLLPKTTLSAGGGTPTRLKSFPADVFAGNYFIKSCNGSFLLLCQLNSKLYPVDDWNSPFSFGILRVMQASEFGLHWFKNFTVKAHMGLTAIAAWGECGVALSFHMWPNAPPKGRIPVFMLLDEGGDRWLHIDSEIFSSNMAAVTYLVEMDGGLAGTNQTALLFISGQDITRDAGLTFAWKMNVTYLLKLSDGALLVCGSATLSVFEPGAVARLEQPKRVAVKFTADIIAATESADSASVVVLLATGVAVTLSRPGWNPRRSDSVGSARTGHGALASLGDSTFAVATAEGLRLLKLSQHGAALPVMFPELGEPIRRIHSLDGGLAGLAVSTANNWVFTYRPADLKAVGLPSRKPFKIFSDGYPITILEVSEDIWVALVRTTGKTSFTIQLYDFGASVYPWCNLTPPIYDQTFYATNWGYQMARGTIVAKDGNVVVLGASGYIWIDRERMKFSSGSKCLLGEPGYHMSHFVKNPFTGFADLGGRVVLSVTSWKEAPCACFKDEGSWRGGAAIYEESNLSSGGGPYLTVGHHETTGALPLRTGGFLLMTGQGLEFYGPMATLHGGEPEDLYLPGVVPLSWKSPALVVAGSVLVAQQVPEGRYSPRDQPMALTCPHGWTSPEGSGSCPVHTWALVNTAPVLLAALCVAVGCTARRWQQLLHRTEASFAVMAACFSPDQISPWCCLGHALVTCWGWRHDAGAAVLHAMAAPMLAAALHAAWLQALSRHGGAFQDLGCHEVLTPFGHRVCKSQNDLSAAIAFVSIACAALAGLILAGSAAGRASTTRWVEASATRSTPLRAAVANFTTWRGKQLVAAGNGLISFCIFLHTHLSLGQTDPLRAITSVCTSLGLLAVVCGVLNAAAWEGRLPLWPEDTHFRATIVLKHVNVGMKLCMLTSKHQVPLGPELEHLWQCRLPWECPSSCTHKPGVCVPIEELQSDSSFAVVDCRCAARWFSILTFSSTCLTQACLLLMALFDGVSAYRAASGRSAHGTRRWCTMLVLHVLLRSTLLIMQLILIVTVLQKDCFSTKEMLFVMALTLPVQQLCNESKCQFCSHLERPRFGVLAGHGASDGGVLLRPLAVLGSIAASTLLLLSSLSCQGCQGCEGVRLIIGLSCLSLAILALLLDPRFWMPSTFLSYLLDPRTALACWTGEP